MQKICIVCGQLFTPTARHERTQITCSAECRKQYARDYARMRQQKPDVKKRRQDLYYRRNQTYCLICGKVIDRSTEDNVMPSTARMHDECVLIDCRNSFLCGQRLTHTQQLRLVYRGYSIKEYFKECCDWRDQHMPIVKYDTQIMRYIPQQFKLAVNSMWFESDTNMYVIELRTAYKDGEFIMNTYKFTTLHSIFDHFRDVRKIQKLSSDFSNN